MLREWSVAEQRYRAVLEVLDGASVTEVSRRFGVSRQTVHAWLRRYAEDGGVVNLDDRTSRPWSCPHQMDPVIESRVLTLRDEHPVWGPDRIRYELEQEDVDGAGLVSGWCRPGRRSTGRWCAVNGSTRPSGNGGGPTIGGGSGAGRWSCGRWTSSAESTCPTGSR